MTEIVVRPFGDRALLIDLPGASARRTAGIARALRGAFPDADVVAGGASVLVEGSVSPAELEIIAANAGDVDLVETKLHEIAVSYDGEDLADVALRIGGSIDDVIALHSAPTYEVEVIGFLPSFAYLGGLEPRLELARRAAPRKRVRAGSVAIASRYSGIHPFSSPGGWHLLGTAIDPRLFDPNREPPSRFQLGDRVRFRPSDRRPDDAADRTVTKTDERGDLEIVRAPPGASIQDLGRPGRRSQGIPTGGAWDSETHRAANRAVGNADERATIEIPLDRFQAKALSAFWYSVDGEPRRRALAGDEIEVRPSESAVRYLAVEGGVDVPVVLGARSTLPVAGLGGLEGRFLRAGDRLRRGSSCGEVTSSAPREARPLQILPGPDVDRFDRGALELFVDGGLRVSTAFDRTGTRLEGDRVRRVDTDTNAPRPMIRGAIQVSTDGTPIVLGPDCAATGGYPVIAVLRESSLSAFARLRPGTVVRFSL